MITGMGIWSCIGKNKEEVRDSLYNGRSGIGIEPERLQYGYRSGLTGILEHPVLKGVLDRRTRVGLSEEAEYAYMAAKEAFEEAGVDRDYLREHEVGIIFGNDSSAKPVIEAAEIMREKHDSALIGSGYIFQSMNSTVNMNLSTIFSPQRHQLHCKCRMRKRFALHRPCIHDDKTRIAGHDSCRGAQETNFYSMATFDALGAFFRCVWTNRQKPLDLLMYRATD